MKPINVAIIADECDIKTKQMLMRKLNRFLDHIPGDLHAYCTRLITSDNIKKELEKTQYTEIEAGPRTMLNVLWNDMEFIDNNIDVVIFGPVYDTDPTLRLYFETIPYAIPTLLWPFHSIIQGSGIRSFSIGIVSRNRMQYLSEDLKLPKFSDDVVRTMLDSDQWDVVKKYAEVDGQPVLTGKQKLCETNLVLRLLRAMITCVRNRDDKQFLNLAKYGAVVRYGVRYGVDYKSAREDLGIDKLIKKYHV